MPRGIRKIIDFDEQLKGIDAKMAALEAERQEIFQKKRAADVEILTAFMNEKGISPEDIISLLSPTIAASTQPKSREV